VVVIGGSASQSAYDLGAVLAIGRDPDNQIQLADPRASRHHARIERSGAGYHLLDLGSSNGTFLNDLPLTAPAPLKHGDQIQVGDTVFSVQAPPMPPGPAAPQTVPADRPTPVRRSTGRMLLWGGLGCLGLAGGLAACGLALRLLDVI
jgi:pSer/pThr/pTyr-binding forkhead associated (FHA) protein